MTKSINTVAINNVFAKADKSQAEFATQLFNLGVFSRADAVPHVMAYVAQTYKAKPYQGQRGMTFVKDSPAAQAVKRILNNCFETVKKASTSNNKVDAVKALVTKYEALTAAEKRRFLAAI
jgi:hypothetical protein